MTRPDRSLATIAPAFMGICVAYILMRLLWLIERLPHTMHWD